MPHEFDHILLIGFGGPEKPEEIRPFLEIVAHGRAIPEHRLREVAAHYEAIGGCSPYNQKVLQLAEQLKAALDREGIALPVFVGMRNWKPFLKDVLSKIHSRELRKGIGIILAPHRSEASYGRYVQTVREAKQSLPFEDYECVYLKPWFDHPLFIQAQAEQVRRTLEQISDKKRAGTHLLFSAHSIPVEMAKQCHYAEEFLKSCELVAQELNDSNWSLAYQSRSGSPRHKKGGQARQPWLEPDICAVIRELKSSGKDSVIVVPLGFIGDNAEILYDLDIEAREEAVKSGVRYFRAPTVIDHPKFAALLTELIQEELAKQLC